MEDRADRQVAAEDLTTRLATMDDYEAVCRFYDEATQANAASQYDVHWDRTLHPSDAMLEAAIRQGEMYLGFLGGTLASATIVDGDFAPGYESIPWKVDAAEDEARCVHLYAVHPSCMGRGVGKRFLQAIQDAVRIQGYKALRLDVLDFNTPALRLYEGAGYVFCQETKLGYEDPRCKDWVFYMYELPL